MNPYANPLGNAFIGVFKVTQPEPSFGYSYPAFVGPYSKLGLNFGPRRNNKEKRHRRALRKKAMSGGAILHQQIPVIYKAW